MPEVKQWENHDEVKVTTPQPDAVAVISIKKLKTKLFNENEVIALHTSRKEALEVQIADLEALAGRPPKEVEEAPK